MKLPGIILFSNGTEELFLARDRKKADEKAMSILRVPCLTGRNLRKAKALYVWFNGEYLKTADRLSSPEKRKQKKEQREITLTKREIREELERRDAGRRRRLVLPLAMAA